MLPAHHPLARRKRIPVELLHDLPCITMERSLAPALYDAIAALYRQARIRMHAVSTADNVLGHLRLVQEGLGFALLSDSMGALLPPASWPNPSSAIRCRRCPLSSPEIGECVATSSAPRRSRPPVRRRRKTRHVLHAGRESLSHSISSRC
jgi:DNA-binding transcriptional LysR family regulator